MEVASKKSSTWGVLMSRESDPTCINMIKGNVLTEKYIKIPRTQAMSRANVVPCVRGKVIDKKTIGCTAANESLKKFLSKNDAFSLLKIMDASIMCKEEEDFIDLLKNFGRLFEAEFSLCLLANVNQKGQIDSVKTFNGSFPSDWLEQYMSKGYYHVDPVVTENFRNYDVQYWESTYRRYIPPPELLRHSFRFGLRKGYSCGAKDRSREKGGSLFSFSGASLNKHPRTEIILKYAVPFLHESLTRILRSSPLSSKNILTIREKDILRCIRDGKTNMETGSCLKITEHTVKFHVKNILYKLNASSRYHALAIALQKKLIEI